MMYSSSFAAHDRVANLPDFALRVLVHNFEVGDGGDAARTPVHDVLAAIDQAFFVEADEGFADGARHAVVHGEVFARPIDGGAEALHLLQDDAAVVLLPIPNAGDEGFAAHVATVLALAGELALHHELGGNSGVVGARQPERRQPAHALPADDDVDLGVLQHVAHVEVTGDIGRRQGDGEGLLSGAGSRGFYMEQLLADPVLGPARFDGTRFVRLGEIMRHANPFRS
jgi:hypothetical protein